MLVAYRNPETRSKLAKFFLVQFLLLVGDVSSLAAFAESIALDGSRENDGGLPFVLNRRLVGGVHFAGVMTALPQCAQRLIRNILDHFQQARV